MPSFTHLRVTLWKNLHMRKYYKVSTILEFVIPVFVFIGGLGFRHLLEQDSHYNRTMNENSAPIFDLLNKYNITIIFTPNDTLTTKFAENVSQILKTNSNSTFTFLGTNSLLHLKNLLSGDLSSVEKEGYYEEATHVFRRAAASKPSNKQKTLAKKMFGIYFRSGADDKKFRYTILTLFPYLQKNSRIYYSDTFAVAKQNQDDEYVKSGFLALQLALDKAFIENNSNSANPDYFNIAVSKLPYSKYLAERNPENLIYHLTLVGFGFLALTIPYNIATEKHSGMKEMMKMMGMSEVFIWFGWITYSLMIYPFVTIFVVVIFRMDLSKGPYYGYIDPLLLWIIFILYCIANMMFLFAMSSLISKHWVALVCSMASHFLSSSPFGLTNFTYSYDQSQYNFLRTGLLCLFPNLVMYNALKALQYLQLKEMYTNLTSFFEDLMIYPQIYSLRSILMYFIVNIIVHSTIIIYISSVHPGRFGYKKHPLFFVITFFNLFRKKKPIARASEFEPIANIFFEPVDEDDIGIRLNNLQKRFGYFSRRLALRNISLNILRGEITVILGHNGAGKSTLLNVICGMTAKTNGEIFQIVDGELQNVKKLVGQLGFCPQNVVYFNYLTVQEHILFFGMTRGLSQMRATREAQFMLNIFDMQDKANNLVYGLSGGMRRKFALLMALIGRPEVLILDEPTNGMDVNSRRVTWDLLKKIRKDRVIIMTTQDMEEADVVGNRIAIMHDGQIFCHGSSHFLNELFGAGYTLKLTVGPDFDERETTRIIKNIIPSASVESDSSSSIDYKLPLSVSGSFAKLFREIEKKLSSLSIYNIQLSCTTMDQIFKNVTFLAGKHVENSVDIPMPSETTPIELRTGIFLVVFQMWALFMKKFRLSYRRHYRVIVCIFIAFLLGYLNVHIINLNYSIFGNADDYPQIDLSIKTYKKPQTFLFYNSTNQHDINLMNCYEKYVIDSGGKVEVKKEISNLNVAENINSFGNRNLYEFRDNLVGAVWLADKKKIFFNELIPHSPPISLNIYTNSLLRYLTNNTTNSSSMDISTAYEPIPAVKYETYCAESDVSSCTLPIFWWVFIFHSAILALFVLIVSSVISERVNGIKHIQTMSSLNEITYWLGNFIYDFLYYVLMITFVILAMVRADWKSFFPWDDLYYLIIGLLLYGVSGILYCYVFATLFDSVSIFMVINVVLNISSMVALLAMEMKKISFMPIFSIIVGILPPFSFLNFLARYLYMQINNNHCVYCPDFEREVCLGKQVISDIESAIRLSDAVFAPPSIFMWYLFWDIWLYIVLLFFLNSILTSLASKFIVGFIFGDDIFVDPNDEQEEDKYVLAEKEYIKSVFDRAQPSDHALMVYNLRKNLIGPGCHKFTAVADINFHVDKGSCFGIVGINGAGKSTTFRILTAFTLPTKGDAKVHNISLRKELRKYASMIGSCPQSNTTFEELTAREMLHLAATLRGLRNANDHVENWISVLSMEDYQNDLIETYSNGGKRKLCVALSLIGDPKVVFLDEPTSGVDPVARQHMYQIIRGKKQSGQSVVIASHNIRECEIICDRVAVLHNGVFQRFGSISGLKKQYANGYTLVVKLRLTVDYSEKVEEIIDDILSSFEKHRCSMRDQRLGILHFRILSDTILWSEMFGTMEDIKRTFDAIIEDYIITNATIAEEIFISELGNPIRSLTI